MVKKETLADLVKEANEKLSAPPTPKLKTELVFSVLPDNLETLERGGVRLKINIPLLATMTAEDQEEFVSKASEILSKTLDTLSGMVSKYSTINQTINLPETLH